MKIDAHTKYIVSCTILLKEFPPALKTEWQFTSCGVAESEYFVACKFAQPTH